MSSMKPFFATLSMLALVACPAPPESGGQAGGPGPGPGAGPGQAGPGPQQGPDGEVRPPENREMNATETAGLPQFKALIDGGADTVTVSGQVSGVASGQVDFQIANKVGEWTVPKVVHTASVSNGSFSVAVPVDYTVPVYVVVINDENGNGRPDPSDPMLYHTEALTIESTDISLEISGGDAPGWLSEVFSDLPDPEAGANVIRDGEPPNAQVLTPDNPVPDGIEGLPPGSIAPNNNNAPPPPGNP